MRANLLMQAASQLNSLTSTFANKALSHDQADALLAKLQKWQTAIDRGLLVFAGLWVCASVAWLASVWGSAELTLSFDTVGQMLMAVMVCAVTGMLASMPLAIWSDRVRSKISSLTPIPGTAYCTYALSLLKADYAEVQAWRDLALAERNVLRVYDVKVMQALHNVAADAARAHHNAADQDVACRQVHGVDASAQ